MGARAFTIPFCCELEELNLRWAACLGRRVNGMQGHDRFDAAAACIVAYAQWQHAGSQSETRCQVDMIAGPRRRCHQKVPSRVRKGLDLSLTGSSP